MVEAEVDAFKRHYLDRRLEHPWLLASVNSFGQEEWFVRVEVAGLHPRRFGPIATREEALNFYTHVLGELSDALDWELPENLPNQRNFGVFIEDEIASAYLLPKGGTHGRH